MNKILMTSQVIRIILVFALILELGMWGYFSFVANDNTTASYSEAAAVLDLVFSFDDLTAEAEQLVAVDMNPIFWLTIHNTLMQFGMYMLLFILFSFYTKGEILSRPTVLHIRRIGLFVLIWPFIEMLYPPLLILSLKVSGALEHGSITLGFGTQHISTIVSGVMIMVIGSIMAEASRLKNEQELVI